MLSYCDFFKSQNSSIDKHFLISQFNKSENTSKKYFYYNCASCQVIAFAPIYSVSIKTEKEIDNNGPIICLSIGAPVRKEYILKIGKMDSVPEKNNKTFTDEVGLLIKLDEYDICPKIKEIWKDKVYTEDNKTIKILCLVMDKWDVAYADFRPINLNKNTEERISHQLFKLIFDERTGILPKFYRSAKLIHGDAHTGNIVLQLDKFGVPIEAALLDLECSAFHGDHIVLNELYPGWNKYLRHIYKNIYQYEICRFLTTSIFNRQISLVPIKCINNYRDLT